MSKKRIYAHNKFGVVWHQPDTHIRRQATEHDCLHSLLGDGEKLSESVRGQGKKCFVLGRLELPRRDNNPLYGHDKPIEPTKEEPLSFVLFESPFPSVSTVSRGHPSLASLS
jgi:hypothetical protein